jgi:hypothetical protein
MQLSFRDRFFTPRVARALMSPLGILLAGVGTAVGVVVGFPFVAAAGIGAVAYAGRVALAIPRGQTTDRIDPMALSVPWRDFVQSAVSAKQRFDRAVNRTERGPLRSTSRPYRPAPMAPGVLAIAPRRRTRRRAGPDRRRHRPP